MKQSFLGMRPRGGRKCFYIEATGIVADESGNEQELTAGMWLAPLHELDYGHATDLAGFLTRAWIGGPTGEPPSDPLTDIFVDELPPYNAVRDIALLVQSQKVAGKLHKAGEISDESVKEDGSRPSFEEYGDLDLAAMAASCHPLFTMAANAVSAIGNIWEGEKRANPTPGSTEPGPPLP